MNNILATNSNIFGGEDSFEVLTTCYKSALIDAFGNQKGNLLANSFDNIIIEVEKEYAYPSNEFFKELYRRLTSEIEQVVVSIQ